MKKTSLISDSILKATFLYSVPLIFANVIQVLFQAADVAVLSFMVDDHAVAAVGACGSIIILLIFLFTGFATGANVLAAKRTGAVDV